MDALLTALLTRSTHRVFSRPGVLEPETLLQLCLPVCILTCLRMAVRMSAQSSSRLYWLPVLCSAISDFHPTNLPTLPPTHPAVGFLALWTLPVSLILPFLPYVEDEWHSNHAGHSLVCCRNVLMYSFIHAYILVKYICMYTGTLVYVYILE